MDYGVYFILSAKWCMSMKSCLFSSLFSAKLFSTVCGKKKKNFLTDSNQWTF